MIESRYINLIRPDNFINEFKDIQEFREWCYLGTIEDLEATLKEFAKYELYEYCQVIKKVKTELELAKSFLLY